jgi:acetate kinase
MGFTPMEGLVMSTRAGSVDPGLILHLARDFGGDFEKVSQLLNKKSGLLGLSGFSADMKELLRVEKDANDPRSISAHEAVDVFVYTVQKYIGQYMASLEFNVDAIVFTGGIGENSPEIRARIMKPFAKVGSVIDPRLNKVTPEDGYISSPDSKIKLITIPTNEELQIAREAVRTASRYI